MSHSRFITAGGLGEAPTQGNIISSTAGDVRIVGRYPERGLPKAGTPFSVDVEVERYRNFWNSALYISCPDAVVVGRDPQTRAALAMTRITTSMWDGCRGQARLVFNRGFVPDRAHPVIFELYQGSVTQYELPEAEPLARSLVMTLDLDIEQGQQSGVYATPTQPWYQFHFPSPTGAFSAVNGTLSKVLWLAGLGAAVYFLGPMLPGLRDSLAKAANTPKNREAADAAAH